MAEKAKDRVIHAEKWSAAAAALLDPACPDIEQVRAQVESDKALLFCLYAGDVRTLAFVLRVDVLANGANQGVIVAAGGRDEINLTDAVLPIIEGMFKDCPSIRIHTRRRGLVKKINSERLPIRGNGVD